MVSDKWHRCSRFWKQGIPCAYEGVPDLHQGIRDPQDEDSPRASQPRTQEAISPEGLKAAETTSKEALKDPKNRVIVKEVQKLWDPPPIPTIGPGRREDTPGGSPVFPPGVPLPSLQPNTKDSVTAQEALRAYYLEANLSGQLSKSPARLRQPSRSTAALGHLEEQYVRDFDSYRNTLKSGQGSGSTGDTSRPQVPTPQTPYIKPRTPRDAEGLRPAPVRGGNLGNAVLPSAILAVSAMAVGASFLSNRGRGRPPGGIGGLRTARGGGFRGFFNANARMLALQGGPGNRNVNDTVAQLGAWRKRRSGGDGFAQGVGRGWFWN